MKTGVGSCGFAATTIRIPMTKRICTGDFGECMEKPRPVQGRFKGEYLGLPDCCQHIAELYG